MFAAAEPQLLPSGMGGPLMGGHGHGPLPPYPPSHFATSCATSSGYHEENLPPFAYAQEQQRRQRMHQLSHQQELEQQQQQQQQAHHPHMLVPPGHFSPPLASYNTATNEAVRKSFSGMNFPQRQGPPAGPPPYSCSPPYPMGMGASPPPPSLSGPPSEMSKQHPPPSSQYPLAHLGNSGSPSSLSPGRTASTHSRFSSPERPGTSSSSSSVPFFPGSPNVSTGSSPGGLPRCSPSRSRAHASPSRALPSPPELLPDLEDHYYYSMPHHAPERQVVVLTSRIKEKVPALAKTRWLDLQLSLRQCPYPIEHIEFTHAGDAVVQFISESAMTKALARPPLVWGSSQQEIGTRPCTEDDITALFWVGLLGVPSELLLLARQALQPFGEVRGEYAPHPSRVDPAAARLQSDLNGHAPEFVPGGMGASAAASAVAAAAAAAGHAGAAPPPLPPPPSASLPRQLMRPFPGSPPLPMPSSVSPPRGGMYGGEPPSTHAPTLLKLYFAPIGRRRLPPTIQILFPDSPKVLVARVFTPYGPLKPKCSDFSATHSKYGCPECMRRAAHARGKTPEPTS